MTFRLPVEPLSPTEVAAGLERLGLPPGHHDGAWFAENAGSLLQAGWPPLSSRDWDGLAPAARLDAARRRDEAVARIRGTWRTDPAARDANDRPDLSGIEDPAERLRAANAFDDRARGVTDENVPVLPPEKTLLSLTPSEVDRLDPVSRLKRAELLDARAARS